VLESLALVVTFYVLLFQLCVVVVYNFVVVVVIGFLFLGVWDRYAYIGLLFIYMISQPTIE
jgi:hypothetical protein